MQFRFQFSTERPLVLPLGYHHILQGFIYHLLETRSPEYSAFLHDHGYAAPDRSFKLFCFSLLGGASYEIHKPDIVFHGPVSFELRSPEREFCSVVLNALSGLETAELNGQILHFDQCEVSSRRIAADDVRIRMISPLTLGTTVYDADGKKKTVYYSPEDDAFEAAFRQNTASKAGAAGIGDTVPDLSLKPLAVSGRDKYVTRFDRRIYITAWKGIYRLSGPPELLTFLYDAGLGARNSQGFGMFELQ